MQEAMQAMLADPAMQQLMQQQMSAMLATPEGQAQMQAMLEQNPMYQRWVATPRPSPSLPCCAESVGLRGGAWPCRRCRTRSCHPACPTLVAAPACAWPLATEAGPRRAPSRLQCRGLQPSAGGADALHAVRPAAPPGHDGPTHAARNAADDAGALGGRVDEKAGLEGRAGADWKRHTVMPQRPRPEVRVQPILW